ncbi:MULTISPECIES: FeoA family protein [Desulfosediminicola]|uniref:FeoA family protein n=1 Tax=Desulfosediminicola TaxID=2886823 RepID=UPI00142EE138|nr:ferrous iron transport protein A [Desulfosediminicola ganghwensis]
MFKKGCWKKQLKGCFFQSKEDNQTTPLSSRCKAGKVRVCKITGDRKLCAKIASLGLFPGSEAELICPANGHQCVVKVYGGNICLDRSISENILVTTD